MLETAEERKVVLEKIELCCEDFQNDYGLFPNSACMPPQTETFLHRQGVIFPGKRFAVIDLGSLAINLFPYCEVVKRVPELFESILSVEHLPIVLSSNPRFKDYTVYYLSEDSGILSQMGG